MVKFKNNARVKITGSFWAKTVATTPIYWYSTSDTNWFNTSLWFSDLNHTTQAGHLPLATEAVYLVSGSVKPLVLLNSTNWPSWNNPESITVGTIGIGLSSDTSRTVATNFRGSGTVSVSGSITIDDPSQ
jgi:hypothetical protein